MRYIDVFGVEDGGPELLGRIYADGRFKGKPSMKLTLEHHSLWDPQTGKRATMGDGLLRAVKAGFNGMLTFTSEGEEDGTDAPQSGSQGANEQPQPQNPPARPQTGARQQPPQSARPGNPDRRPGR